MILSALLAVALAASPAATAAKPNAPVAAAARRVTTALRAKHGEPQRARIDRGVAQVAAMWRPSDGAPAAFEAFALQQFVSDPKQLDLLFGRLEAQLEQLDGHALEVQRTMKWPTDVEAGPVLPVDELFAAYDPSGEVVDKLFETKVAFTALLNFPLTTLDERLTHGERWSRRQWAEARLALRFARRVPAEVEAKAAKARADADLYISGYNLYLHHLVQGSWDAPERPFPKGMRLLSHWNLRDQIKAEYARPDGLPRQRLIAKAMERIVSQEIPAAVVNDPRVDWNPLTNEVRPSPAETIEPAADAEAQATSEPRAALAKVSAAREADTRYARLLGQFRAARLADPYSPTVPTLIARKFDLEREIPEERVVAMLDEVLDSPLVPRLAKIVEHRLGRPLEPFDVWYDGFRPRSRYAEADLDAMTKKRYPTAAAFEKEVPNVLTALGFTPEKARFLADRIAVDPARGSGHAMEARRRGDKPHLRTRIGPGGMDYKGFNIAVHELGHNVEQVLSLYEVDHTLLAGVPNTAFTEALAFVFQARDLEVLGLAKPDAEAKRLVALNDLWMTVEIAGVGLVDLGVWRWMYAHPNTTPAQLREATVAISKAVWNRHFAKLFGVRDSTLLGVYSHMVNETLYLPDYPVGHLIQAQIEEKLEGIPAIGAEYERMASFGSVAPDLWMKNAAGAPVSPAALFRSAEKALVQVEQTTAR